MKTYKLKLENLELYVYIILSLILLVVFIFFYNFINEKVYKPITSQEVILDPASIRIDDVNISKFEGVLENIKKKSVSQKVNSKNVFK